MDGSVTFLIDHLVSVGNEENVVCNLVMTVSTRDIKRCVTIVGGREISAMFNKFPDDPDDFQVTLINRGGSTKNFV